MANQHCKQTADSINIKKTSDLIHFSHVENDKCFYPSEKSISCIPKSLSIFKGQHFQFQNVQKVEIIFAYSFRKCKSKGTLIKVMKRYHHFYLWKNFLQQNVLLCSYFYFCRRNIYKRICKRREKSAFYDKVTIHLGFFVTQYKSNSKNC